MNGQVTGFFPSSVFQVSPGYNPDFWSASAGTTHTAFHHHTAKLCPVAGWWSRHRGCRLLWEWHYQVRKLAVRVNRAGVVFKCKPEILCPGLSHSLEGIPRASSAMWSCFVFLNCLTLKKQLYPKIETLSPLSTYRPHYLILILCCHYLPVSHQNRVKWLQWAMLPGNISLFSLKDIEFTFSLKIVPQYCLLACNLFEQTQIFYYPSPHPAKFLESHPERLQSASSWQAAGDHR